MTYRPPWSPRRWRVNAQLALFEQWEPELRIWRQLPEESRQRTVELFAAVLIEHLVYGLEAKDEVDSER